MRVGLDIRPALAGRAGIGRYCHELVAALAAIPDGPALHLYALGRSPRLEPPPEAGKRIHLHQSRIPARLARILHRLPGLDAGRMPARVDVFHWTDFVYPPVRSAPAVATLHDASFLVDPSFHGANSETLRRRWAAILPHCRRVIVSSEPAREDAAMAGVPDRLVRVVPDGVSPFFRPGASPPPADAPLLTVGTIEPRKNHLRILEALESLWDRDAAPDWQLIGRAGWECEAFLDRLAGSRHRRRVRWHTRAGDAELLAAYQGARALVYPSLHEGFGLPVLEAMACGLPVLVGAGTAPAWLAGADAMLADPRSTESIRAALERILGEPDLAGRTGLRLRNRAAAFSWDRTARGTLGVYRELL